MDRICSGPVEVGDPVPLGLGRKITVPYEKSNFDERLLACGHLAERAMFVAPPAALSPVPPFIITPLWWSMQERERERETERERSRAPLMGSPPRLLLGLCATFVTLGRWKPTKQGWIDVA